MGFNTKYISVSNTVRYRKEYFGGIIFETKTGTMVDVDREALLVISMIQALDIVKIDDIPLLWLKALNKKPPQEKKIIQIIGRFLACGILTAMPNGILNKDYEVKIENWDPDLAHWPVKNVISAPETVHWALTHRCDSNCPDCYVRRHRYDFRPELDTKQALTVVDKIADAGVFQLALGGGEPLLRDDIVRILARAHERNLVVHLTSGRYRHEPGILRAIAPYLKSIQIGIKYQELIKNPVRELEKLNNYNNSLGEYGIYAGANLILSRSTLGEFEQVIDLLSTAGFRRITLLRYKPPQDRKRWLEEKPGAEAILEFEQKLPEIVESYPHIQFRLDCGLAFLERRLSSELALEHGFMGCSAARRILSMGPDGSLFPCSQLVGGQFYAGNLLNDDLQSIWVNSEVFARYRRFRTKKVFKKSICGQCAAKTHCGGCRVFADDALGADPGCPEPVLPPAQLRKYHQDQYDSLIGVQECIGYTDAGFPDASLEEIEKWLEEDNARDFPRWLIEN